MGQLRQVSTGSVIELRAQQTIGRAPECAVRIPVAVVSSQHASLRWTGSGWSIRDLGSRNGTLVDGTAIQPRVETPLTVGAQLVFGRREHAWELLDASAPVTAARTADGSQRIIATEGMLELTDSNDEVTAMAFDTGQGWVLELDSGEQPVLSGELLDVGGRLWIIDLAHTHGLTADISQPGHADLSLLFRVSLDEEYIEVVARQHGRHQKLEPRAHNELLLVLARRRADDAAERPDDPETSHGWVYAEELERMLRVKPARIRMDIFRARRQLAEAGFVGGSTVVERRPSPRMLRMGLSQLTFERV